jgi:hypothetical protein
LRTALVATASETLAASVCDRLVDTFGGVVIEDRGTAGKSFGEGV